MKLNVSFVASNTVVMLAEALIFFKEPTFVVYMKEVAVEVAMMNELVF